MNSEMKANNLFKEARKVIGQLPPPSFSPRVRLMAITGAVVLALTLTGCTEISDLAAGRNPNTKIELTECQGELTLATIRDRVKKARYRGAFDGESEVTAFNNASCDPDIYQAQVLGHDVVPCRGVKLTWKEMYERLSVAGYDHASHKVRGRSMIEAFKRTAVECLNS
ncbi:MAG: hypothetical protein Q7S88_00830 [Candidatus Daviesbacteria bacterium]|nr:hypothetical protein [Candidatus Daviesbacteria bacterium]